MMQIFRLLGAMLDDLAEPDYMQATLTEDNDSFKFGYTYTPIIETILECMGLKKRSWKNAFIMFTKIGENYVIKEISFMEKSEQMIFDGEAINSYIFKHDMDKSYWKICGEIVEYGKISL